VFSEAKESEIREKIVDLREKLLLVHDKADLLYSLLLNRAKQLNGCHIQVRY
jgi:hypothetical protein